MGDKEENDNKVLTEEEAAADKNPNFTRKAIIEFNGSIKNLESIRKAINILIDDIIFKEGYLEERCKQKGINIEVLSVAGNRIGSNKFIYDEASIEVK